MCTLLKGSDIRTFELNFKLIPNQQGLLFWWTKACPWLQNKQLVCLVLKRLAFRDSEVRCCFQFLNETLISGCSRPCWHVPGFHSHASLLEFCFTVSFCSHTQKFPPPFAIKRLLKHPAVIRLSHMPHPEEFLLQHAESTSVLRNWLH